jgi:hypothetical protein
VTNLIEALSTNFPENFKTIQHYFKYNPSIINSENKQIQMFIVLLDIITNSIQDQLILNSSTQHSQEQFNLKYISVLDAMFVDFCKHLSQNSNHRAEFLRNIWIRRVECMENLIEFLKEKIDTQNAYINNIMEDNQKFLTILSGNDKKQDELQTNIRVLTRENERWLHMAIEKDAKEKELQKKIDELERDLDEKNSAYAELLFKFNSRLNPHLRKQVFNDFVEASGNGNILPNNMVETQQSQTNLKEEGTAGIFRRGGLIFKTSQNKAMGLTKSSKNVMLNVNNLHGGLNKNASTSSLLNPSKFSTHNIPKVERPPSNRNNLFNNMIKSPEVNVVDSLLDKSNFELDGQSINNDGPINLDLKDLVRSRISRNTQGSQGNGGKNLKTKINENQVEQRRNKIINNNILALERGNEQFINSNLTNKRQFQLYLNKGMNIHWESLKNAEVQTEIVGTHLESIMNNGTFKKLNYGSQEIINDMDELQERLSFKEKNFKPEELKGALMQVREKYQRMYEEMTKYLEECDIVMKDNDQLREKMEKYVDQNDNLRETYSEIFQIFMICLSDSNTEIHNFMQEKQNSIEPEYKQILNSILERNSHTVEKETVAPIFKLLPDQEMKKNLVRRLSNINSKLIVGDTLLNSPGKRTKIVKESAGIDKKYLTTSNYKPIYQEFYQNKGKIKVHISQKKVIKIINSIYFDYLEKIYFKTDKSTFDKDDDFLDFPEVMYIYFFQNFGLESLAKKKFLEFLQAVITMQNSSKRIFIFGKLIRIFNEKVFERNSEKQNMKFVFDIFVTRQILSLIQQFKINNCVLKSPDENNQTIYLIHAKLNEIILTQFQKFPVKQETKIKISSFLEKNKKTFTKNMKSFVVIDFDDLIELISDVLIDLKSIYARLLRSIFRAIDVLNIFKCRLRRSIT